MSSSLSRVRIATRGSKLALAQAAIVEALLRARSPGVEVEVVPVTTRGDVDQRPFAAIGGKGLFVKEVEAALVQGVADIAVHSAKDLTSELAPGCAVVCVPERVDPRDVVVGGEGAAAEERLASLRPDARVGTSSMRRIALLRELRPDLEPTPLRGNLDTRLRKVRDRDVDAAIVAVAGVDRLGAFDESTMSRLDPDRWVPAPGQATLAVEALEERSELRALLEPVNDVSAAAELTCERAFARTLEGGCSIPIGCLARASGSDLIAAGYLGHPDGGQPLRDRISGPPAQAHQLGVELATAILDAGGDEWIAELQEMERPTPAAP